MELKYVECSKLIDVRDGTHDSPKYISNGEGYPLITSKNIKNNNIEFEDVNYISEEDYIRIIKRSKVDNGDIIMPMIGTIGNPVIVGNNTEFAIKNVALFKLSNSKTLNSKFFYYLLGSNVIKRQLEKNKRGGTQNFVSLKNLRELRIPVLDVIKQNNIVKVLDKAQDLIDKRKEQIEALDELVKARFVEMFGDPINNLKKFKVKKIKEVSKYLKRGISPKYIESSEIKVINQRCIYWKELKKENCKYYDELLKNKLENSLLEDNDILINSTGTGTLGRAVVLNLKSNEIYVADSHVTVLRTISIYINPIFLTTLFEFENIQDTIYRKCVNGSTNQIELSVAKLGEYQIIVPPTELQNQFANFVTQVDKLKSEIEISLKELEDNFNALMQKAFKGELFN